MCTYGHVELIAVVDEVFWGNVDRLTDKELHLTSDLPPLSRREIDRYRERVGGE